MAHTVVRLTAKGKVVTVNVFHGWDSRLRANAHATRLHVLTASVFWVENRPDLDYV